MFQKPPRQTTRREALAAAAGTAGLLVGAGTQTQAAEASNGPLKGKRVLLAISDFSESLETYYMFFRLKEEGAVPVVVAPKRKTVEMVIHFDHPDYLSYLGAIRSKPRWRPGRSIPANTTACCCPVGERPRKCVWTRAFGKSSPIIWDRRNRWGPCATG